MRPAESSPLAAWMSASSIDRCHAAGTSDAERAVALSPLDERHEDGEDRLVHGVEVGMGEAGVDLDEGMEAPERPPRSRQDSPERVRGIATRGLDCLDRVGHVGDRALRDGFDQVLAGGEVDVDRRSHDAGAASDRGHAGLGIARQRIEGRVEDAVDAALRVGPSRGRAGRRVGSGGRHQWTATGGASTQLGQEAACGREDRKREHARDTGEPTGDEERVTDPAGKR